MFTREDTPTIMDGVVVRYKTSYGNEISASRNKVNIEMVGVGIRAQEQLDEVIEYLRRAFRQYVQLSQHDHEPFPEEVFKP